MEYQLLRGSLTQVWFSAVLAAMAPISWKSELVVWKTRIAKPTDHVATDGW